MLIGISHLDDLFFDRRVSTHIIDSRVKYYFKKAWKKKFSVAGSPLKGDYIVDGFEKADELHYLLVPKTKVGKYFSPVDRFNVAHLINFSKDNKLVSVRVDDGPSQSFEGIKKSMYIIAYFNYDFQSAGFSTSDQYDIASEKLLPKDKIVSKPDYDYFEAFKDSVMYWNGQQFVLRDDMIDDRASP